MKKGTIVAIRTTQNYYYFIHFNFPNFPRIHRRRLQSTELRRSTTEERKAFLSLLRSIEVLTETVFLIFSKIDVRSAYIYPPETPLVGKLLGCCCCFFTFIAIFITTMSTSTENGKNLWRETIESTRNIFISNIRHFHVISIFFILPIIFTLIVYPYFHLSIFHPDYDFTGFAQDNISHYENILPGDLFSMLLFLCAVAIIVCSVVQALCSRSINLVSSIKSIRNFIILFLFFLIFSQIISIPISLLFGNQFQFPQLSVSIFETVVFIVYALFLCLFFIFAVATTTYSSVEVFYGRPVDLFSSIKSIRNSFFPLLSTFIVSNIIYVSIALVFALIFVFSVKILQSLRLIELKYDSDYLFLLVIFGLIVLVPVLIWLQVNWSLAYVITVVEFKSGYETLRRSAEMVKGNRSIALRILLYYGFVIVSMVIGAAVFLYLVDAGKGEEWRSLRVILQTVLASVLGYVLMNQYLVANMVLYMYCKGLNDEKSPSENAAGDGEYVSLPFEEEEEKNQATV